MAFAPSRPLRFLVAEDDPMNALVLCQMLDGQGIHYEMAANGETAVVLFAQKTFQLVFMDCQMPIMNGYMATQAIRDLEQGWSSSRTPIIAMTAEDSAECRDRVRYCGMDGQITKPLTPGKLANAVNLHIPGRASQPVPAFTARLGELPIKMMNSDSIDAVAMNKLHVLLGPALGRLLNTYIDNGIRLIGDIDKASREGNTETLALAAHALKGSSRTVTAHRVAGLAGKIETRARAGGVPTPDTIAHLLKEFEAACESLSGLPPDLPIGT